MRASVIGKIVLFQFIFLVARSIAQVDVRETVSNAPITKIRPWRVNFELGKSPLPYPPSAIHVTNKKNYPYYKLSFAGCIPLSRDNRFYFVAGAGFAMERAYYFYFYNYSNPFIYSDTVNNVVVNRIGTRGGSHSEFHETKSYYIPFDLSLMQVFNPFKNDNLLWDYSIGMTIRPLLLRESKSIYMHFSDSTTSHGKVVFPSSRTDIEHSTPVRIDGPVDLMFNFGLGFEVVGKQVQQHFGFVLNLQTTAPSTTLLYYNRGFVRAYYGIGF
jgi:hypothetical protein